MEDARIPSFPPRQERARRETTGGTGAYRRPGTAQSKRNAAHGEGQVRAVSGGRWSRAGPAALSARGNRGAGRRRGAGPRPLAAGRPGGSVSNQIARPGCPRSGRARSGSPAPLGSPSTQIRGPHSRGAIPANAIAPVSRAAWERDPTRTPQEPSRGRCPRAGDLTEGASARDQGRGVAMRGRRRGMVLPQGARPLRGHPGRAISSYDGRPGAACQRPEGAPCPAGAADPEAEAADLEAEAADHDPASYFFTSA